MSTPEGHKEDSLVQGAPAVIIDENPQETLTSPRDSGSDIAFPFDTQSSIDEESGNRKTSGNIL